MYLLFSYVFFDNCGVALTASFVVVGIYNALLDHRIHLRLNKVSTLEHLMATFDQFVSSIRQEFGEQDAGKKFEVFCKWFLENDPDGSKTVDRVCPGMSTQINGSDSRMKSADHQKFLSSLSNETRASLIQRTNRHGVAHLAVHWALIILFGLAIYFALPGWQLLLVPQGILIVFLFTLLSSTKTYLYSLLSSITSIPP